MKNQQGFSLIELLIVVVIIGVIAAIAIPNLLASRRAANEASSIASLRTYHGVQMTYQATAGAGHFAGESGNAFIQLGNMNLLDDVLGTGTKSGFNFDGGATPPLNGNPATFYGTATPVVSLAANTNYGGGGGPGFATIMFLQIDFQTTNEGASMISATGSRRFALATDGVIYYETTSGGYFMFPSSEGFDEGTGNITIGYRIYGGTVLENTSKKEETTFYLKAR